MLSNMTEDDTSGEYTANTKSEQMFGNGKLYTIIKGFQ